MTIDLINLKDATNKDILVELKPIIDDNLLQNGGTIGQANELSDDYDWTHLFLAKEEGRIIGFAILRRSYEDDHGTGFRNYYYISDVILYRAYHGKGYGTALLKKVLDCICDLPVVAAVKYNNNASLKMCEKLMTSYDFNGFYYRFMDNNHYEMKANRSSNSFGRK